jgi:hypothetical protein
MPRKKREKKPIKSEVLVVRLQPEELTRLDAIAETLGIPHSTALRFILNAVEVQPPVLSFPGMPPIAQKKV